MRISTNYIYENSRRTMQQSISNLLQAQEVMATQRKVNRLSDDPVASGRILNTRAMISQQDKFLRNLETADTFADLYDGSMDTIVTTLKRAKELLLGEANSAASTDQSREAARIEIVSLASQLVSVGNLQYSDRFLYGGYQDSQPPFLDMYASVNAGVGNSGGAGVVSQAIHDPSLVTGDACQVMFTGAGTFDVIDTTTGTPVLQNQAYTSGEPIRFEGINLQISDVMGTPAAGDTFDVSVTSAGTFVGDSGVVRLEIEQDVFHQVNFTGDRVFQGQGLSDGVNLFEVFERVNTALRTNDQTEINALLEDFDKGLEQVTSQQSLAGSRQNLFENTMERLLDVKLNLEVLLSDLRDVDITEAVTALNKQENAYQAVLSATAKILQPNLLDFLG